MTQNRFPHRNWKRERTRIGARGKAGNEDAVLLALGL